jgi:hypothetical protein
VPGALAAAIDPVLDPALGAAGELTTTALDLLGGLLTP